MAPTQSAWRGSDARSREMIRRDPAVLPESHGALCPSHVDRPARAWARPAPMRPPEHARNELLTTMTLSTNSTSAPWLSVFVTTLVLTGCSSGEDKRGEPRSPASAARAKTAARAPAQLARIAKAGSIEGGTQVPASAKTAANAQGSPHAMAGSVGAAKGPPHAAAGAPHGAQGSPHGMAGSPPPGQGSPHAMAGSVGAAKGPPHAAAGAPHGAQGSPHGMAGSPPPGQGSPHAAAGAPLQGQGSPHAAAGAPHGAQGSPHGMAGAPLQGQGSPHAAAGAPHGAQGSPHGVAGPAGAVQGSPHGMAGTSPTMAGSPHAGASGGPAAGGSTVAGSITVTPALAALVKGGSVLFIVARPDDGSDSRKPAVAVRRIAVTGPEVFPVHYELGAGDGAISGRVRIEARLDGDGDALSRRPGDLFGRAPQAVTAGERHADFMLNEKI